jgi:hypothetical protein
VAHATNGKWIYLFHPDHAPKKPNPDGLVQTGVFRAEPLVNMSRHHYHLEPNVNFSPDGKWIVFRSNMFGPPYVFAVEIAEASTKRPAQPLNQNPSGVTDNSPGQASLRAPPWVIQSRTSAAVCEDARSAHLICGHGFY